MHCSTENSYPEIYQKKILKHYTIKSQPNQKRVNKRKEEVKKLTQLHTSKNQKYNIQGAPPRPNKNVSVLQHNLIKTRKQDDLPAAKARYQVRVAPPSIQL